MLVSLFNMMIYSFIAFFSDCWFCTIWILLYIFINTKELISPAPRNHLIYSSWKPLTPEKNISGTFGAPGGGKFHSAGRDVLWLNSYYSIQTTLCHPSFLTAFGSRLSQFASRSNLPSKGIFLEPVLLFWNLSALKLYFVWKKPTDK